MRRGIVAFMALLERVREWLGSIGRDASAMPAVELPANAREARSAVEREHCRPEVQRPSDPPKARAH